MHIPVLELARIFFGNKLAKTGSILTIMGASALVGWVDQVVAQLLGITIQQPTTWIGFAVMVIGLALLLINWRYASTQNRASEHDISLIARLRSVATENVLDFLRHHNFGTPWRRSILDPIAEIAEGWNGPRFEFQDPELNAVLARVKAAANKLEQLIACGSWPMRSNAEMQTAKTDEDYAIGTQAATIRKIKELNGSASTLVKAIDELERLAQKKLGS